MPRISALYRIVIMMYFGDDPPPHFHARYGEHVAEIAIDALELIDGWLPPRACSGSTSSGPASIKLSSTPTGTRPRTRTLVGIDPP